MGKTSIEWTDASWNPVVGCTEVSPGCANCYAARLAATRLKNISSYKNLSDKRRGQHHWLGTVRALPERLREPQEWRKPRRIFVCDMGDLFHENVEQGTLLAVFNAMAAAPQHTYQILTKRAARMREWLRAFALIEKYHPIRDDCRWPWPNVWCGVSVENQHFTDERIPLLLQTPAVIRFLSIEPLLGEVNLSKFLSRPTYPDARPERQDEYAEKWKKLHPILDWVIVGGESGPGARPMHPHWARLLRDQCQAAGVPFFFKQWGEFAPLGTQHNLMIRVGKKKAGRLLDGREWSEFPNG